jgi:hypothetical protein
MLDLIIGDDHAFDREPVSAPAPAPACASRWVGSGARPGRSGAPDRPLRARADLAGQPKPPVVRCVVTEGQRADRWRSGANTCLVICIFPPRESDGSVPHRRLRLRELLLGVGAYTLTFALALRHWLPHAASVLPGAHHLTDTEFHVWVIGWVAHALATAPERLFAAPFNYPAPSQLAGMDWFASSHLVSAPVYWLSGNPVLAANVLALTSYLVGAIAMACLLVALGCVPVVAWVGGFVFATGPRYVPFNLMMIEFQNLFLPLAALALVRLRDRPGLRPALGFGLAYAAGLFSSYYSAAMLTGMVVVWVTCELAAPAPGRARFAGSVAVVAAVAIGLLVVASGPYLARGSSGAGMDVGGAVPFSAAALVQIGRRALFGVLRPSLLFDGPITAGLGVCACLAFFADRDLRRLVVRGVVIMLSVLFVWGAWPHLLGWMPQPLRFFRAPRRLEIVSAFGATLLSAAGLEAIRRRLGRTTGALVVLAVAVALVSTRGRSLGEFPFHRELAVTEHAPVYAAVGTAARANGGGALLELPLAGALERRDTLYNGTIGRASFEPSAMLGGLVHGLPLVNGYTAYHPPHRQLLLEAVRRLPAEDALQDLVDMTHLRFLLLRPAAYWRQPKLRAAMLRIRRTSPVLFRDGWVLLRIDGTPRHPEWFAAIAAGTGRRETALGTPLAPLDRAAAVARFDRLDLPARLFPGAPLVVGLTVHNDGIATWPVAAPPRRPLTGALPASRDVTLPYVVHLVVEWRALREHGGPNPAGQVALVRDVPAGESVSQQLWLVTPSVPGDYDVIVHVVQTNGPRFRGSLRRRVTIDARHAAVAAGARACREATARSAGNG